MILYKLQCCDEHSFDGWFRDSKTFDRQAKAGQIECPYCGKTEISKAPMAPNIAKSASHDVESANPIVGDRVTETRAHQVAQQILEAATKAREYVEKNYEDVGDKFADEARAMHYGEREEGGIYGHASEKEEKELEEEGIDFVRIPGSDRKNS